MPLEDLQLNIKAPQLSPGVEALIHEADNRIDQFLDSLDGPLVSPFLPSDFRMVYATLQAIAEKKLAMGDLFCEWGSGFGVITCLASLLGFDSCGIEINEQLVEEAGTLAKLFDVNASFVCGNYLPAGYDFFNEAIGGSHQLLRAPTNGVIRGWYAELDAAVEDFDVIFAYPWPKEEELLESLFEEAAAEGALFVTYHGFEDLRVRRKV